MTSLIQVKGTGSSLFRRAFLLTLLLLVCFTVSPSTQAVLPPPPPDGGYPGGNTAEGTEALFKLPIEDIENGDEGEAGKNNTAIGFRTLYENDIGFKNTAVGSLALKNSTRGQWNTATGYQALYNSSPGIYAVVSDTATGYKALALIGGSSGHSTVMGSEVVSQLTRGGENIVVGARAGNNLTRGGLNIYIGNEGVANEGSAIRIGDPQTDRTFISGIFGVDVGIAPVVVNAEGQMGAVVFSSQRFKDEIRPMGKASEAILALKPVTFRYKKEVDPENAPQFGLVAEDVDKIDSELVVRDKEGKPYSVRYDQVNAMLLNEFLKAHLEIDEQEATMAQQQKEIEALAADLEKVNAQLAAASPSNGGLEANSPQDESPVADVRRK